MAENNREIASQVLKLVGGKENVEFVTHCITRLRFTLKDKSKADTEAIKQIKGIIGVNIAGAQYQVIVGPQVDNVYGELCSIGNFQEMVEEKKEKQPFSLKNLGNTILDYLSGSLTPGIPVMLAASIFKMLATVLGPSMLNLLSETSDLYILFTLVGDTGFYFFPVLVGYTSAKKFGLTPVMGVFFGGILIHPTIINMAAEGTAFTVYGIPAVIQNYSSTLLPIVLTVWIATYIERFFKKIIPASLRILGVPVLTTGVVLPLMLCILGPLGGFLGTFICSAIIGLGSVAGPVGSMIIGGVWEFLVMTGMHQVMISSMLMLFVENGFDPVVTLGAACASLSVTGMCLGYFFATKDREQKSLAMTNTVSAFVGGVTEPGLYGTGIANKKPLIGMIAGGAAGGLYAGLMGVKAYNLVPVASFLAVTSFAGGEGAANMVNGVIAGGIAIAVAAIVTYILCRDSKHEGISKEVKEEYPAIMVGDTDIVAMADGELIDVSEVTDETFSNKIMGETVAFRYSTDKIVLCSPATGTLSALFPTGHAFGVTMKNGTELLVHCGVNTVETNGDGFRILEKKQGDSVLAGNPIVEVDLKKLRETYDMSTMLIVTDDGGKKISFKNPGTVKRGQKVTE